MAPQNGSDYMPRRGSSAPSIRFDSVAGCAADSVNGSARAKSVESGFHPGWEAAALAARSTGLATTCADGAARRAAIAAPGTRRRVAPLHAARLANVDDARASMVGCSLVRCGAHAVLRKCSRVGVLSTARRVWYGPSWWCRSYSVIFGIVSVRSGLISLRYCLGAVTGRGIDRQASALPKKNTRRSLRFAE